MAQVGLTCGIVAALLPWASAFSHVAPTGGGTAALAGWRGTRATTAARQISLAAALEALAGSGTADAARVLREAGTGIEVRDRLGRTALAIAAQLGDVRAVAVLLAAGARLDVRTNIGEQPLHLAAAAVTSDAVAPLLAAGADVNARVLGRGPRQGWTALIEAAAFGRAAAARLLLRAHADVHLRSDRERTALVFAAWYGYEQIASLLLDAGAATEAVDAVGIDPARAAGLAGNLTILRRIEHTHGLRAKRR